MGPRVTRPQMQVSPFAEKNPITPTPVASGAFEKRQRQVVHRCEGSFHSRLPSNGRNSMERPLFHDITPQETIRSGGLDPQSHEQKGQRFSYAQDCAILPVCKAHYCAETASRTSCKNAHMVDRQKLRAEQQGLIRKAAQVSGLKPSAVAVKIGVRPSTLNKVLDEKHTHLLSASTVALLEAFIDSEGKPEAVTSSPPAEGALDIDPEIIRDLLNSPENKKLLGLWIGMDTSTKLATLDILEAVTRITRHKAG